MAAASLQRPTLTRSLSLAWSGGKDSSLAFWSLREQEGRLPGSLLTTVTADYERISMHGVRRDLLRRQAESLGVPLVEVEIPTPCPNDVYEARMAAALASEEMAGVEEVAFGDLFLQDIREYRESRLKPAGLRAHFPVWGMDTTELAQRFVQLGFRAILVCVDPRALDGSFAGREFDEGLLEDLPDGVDPCGENGEFHTFVYDGPIFDAAVSCERGEVVEREGFVFCDLLAADTAAEEPAGGGSAAGIACKEPT
ncbi:MAG: ATP-binding protein [Solirubrobacteraceae bacterium]